MNPDQVSLLIALIGAGNNITTDGVNYILPSGEVAAASDVNEALTTLAGLLSNTQLAVQGGPVPSALASFLAVLQSL